jgi:hypothetical protein
LPYFYFLPLWRSLLRQPANVEGRRQLQPLQRTLRLLNLPRAGPMDA